MLLYISYYDAIAVPLENIIQMSGDVLLLRPLLLIVSMYIQAEVYFQQYLSNADLTHNAHVKLASLPRVFSNTYADGFKS